MPNNKKSKGANMNEADKMALKASILQQFPNLKIFEHELDFMIDEYNKDKGYIKRLAMKAQPVQDVADNIESTAEMRTIRPDEPEYQRIMDALDEARRQHEEKIQKGYEEEQRLKKISNGSNIDNVPVHS